MHDLSPVSRVNTASVLSGIGRARVPTASPVERPSPRPAPREASATPGVRRVWKVGVREAAATPH